MPSRTNRLCKRCNYLTEHKTSWWKHHSQAPPTTACPARLVMALVVVRRPPVCSVDDMAMGWCMISGRERESDKGRESLRHRETRERQKREDVEERVKET